MPAKAKLTTRERTTSNVSSDNLNKGSELSFAQADSNFFNLRDQTIAISDGTTSTDIEAGETITFSGASVSGNTVTVPTGAGMTIVGDDSTGTLINGGETLKIAGGSNVTTAMSGDTLTITASGGSGTVGDLTIIGSTITSPTNAELTFEPNSTGNILAIVEKFTIGADTDFTDITTTSGSAMRLSTNNNTSSGSILINADANNNIVLTPHGTGKVVIKNLSINGLVDLPTSDPSTAGQIWNDSGTLKVSAG